MKDFEDRLKEEYTTFADKLKEVDKGRFKKLIDAMDVDDNCENCGFWNYKHKDNLFRCAVSPSCIGVTLSQELKSYILWQLGEISYEEHMQNLGVDK